MRFGFCGWMFFYTVFLTAHINVAPLHQNEDGHRGEDNKTNKNFDHDAK